MVDVPIRSQQEMRALYDEMGEGVRWRNFCNCQKHPFMKKMKLKAQYYICPVCSKPLKFGITNGHHTTYERICITKDRTEVNGRHMADCESCFENHMNEFIKCMHDIVYVHSRCHMKIHDV